MLAPWAPEADVTVTLVNQTKTRDREFVVTREELAARASAESMAVRKSKFAASASTPSTRRLLHPAHLFICTQVDVRVPAVVRKEWDGRGRCGPRGPRDVGSGVLR